VRQLSSTRIDHRDGNALVTFSVYLNEQEPSSWPYDEPGKTTYQCVVSIQARHPAVPSMEAVVLPAYVYQSQDYHGERAIICWLLKYTRECLLLYPGSKSRTAYEDTLEELRSRRRPGHAA
jgi:hypothetical protein